MFWNRRPVVPGLIACAAAAFYVTWEAAHRGVFAYTQSIYHVDDADEWRYVACSRLVAHGYRIFDQVFSAQPPLLFASLAAGMKLFGDDITGARWIEILCGCLALGTTGWIAGRLAGRWAAAGTVALLAISPGFLIYFHTIEAEGPMMALTALSLAFCAESNHCRGTASGRSLLLAVLGGIALAGAVLMKLFALEAVLPALWLLTMWRRGESVRDVAAFLGGLAAPIVLEFALISPAAQWQQVVEMHNSAASARLPDLTPAHEIMQQFLTLDAGLSLLAAAGLICLFLRRRWRDLGFVALWLLGSIAMLLVFRPLFPHHAAILLAPLGVAAGAAVGMGIDAAWGRRVPVLVVAGTAALAYVALGVRIVHDDRQALLAAGPSPSEALAVFIADRTTSGDLVASDDTRAADIASRLVAPPLCDPSTVRLKAGYLTAADLISATRTYRVRLVAPTTGLFAQVPRYIGWLRTHYRAVAGPYGQTVYLRR